MKLYNGSSAQNEPNLVIPCLSHFHRYYRNRSNNQGSGIERLVHDISHTSPAKWERGIDETIRPLGLGRSLVAKLSVSKGNRGDLFALIPDARSLGSNLGVKPP